MIIKRAKEQDKRKITSVKMTLDLRTFDILCRYVLSSSSYLRITHLVNLQKLIYALVPDTYQNDPEKLKRVKFIKRALEARIDYNLNNTMMIIEHIVNGFEIDIDFIDFNDIEIDANSIMWVHQMVSEALEYAFVYDATDYMLDLCTKIQSSDYQHRGNYIREFEALVDNLKNQFRKVKTDNSLTDMTFSLRGEQFAQVVTETYNLITNPSRRLICGMQGLNEMIGGGFESGRVYMLLGITGIGKSVSLLNLVYQLKKYNKNYKTKDPTKTPCILMLTMENTVVETITRLFDLSTNGNLGMANYTIDEVLRKLREEGELVLNDDSPIDIVIKYKANKSVDTSYLYTLVDDLEDDGYEVICLVQDHVKRIRSIYNSPDLRIELGEIVNEFKVFAATKDIPVITNSHLNRDAARIIEEGNSKSSKTDITMKLGKSNAGESLLMMDNIDAAIIINLDFDDEGNKYMVYSLVKMRDKTERTYIAQPFLYGSGIRMVEDVGGVPMFREHLHMNDDMNSRMPSIRTSSANVMNNINNIMSSTNNNKNNSFAQNSFYSFGPEAEQDNNEEKIVYKQIIQPFKFVDIPAKDNKPTVDINQLRAKITA